MWQIVGHILVGLLCIAGVGMTLFRLPGTWLIVATALVHAWLMDFADIGIATLIVLALAALIGEVLEIAMSAVMARRSGASARAAWGGLIGGFLGMFLFTLPLPMIGTLAGAVIGCFVGALIGELSHRRQLAHGTRVGIASAIGYVLGVMFKTAVAFFMATLIIVSLIRANLGTQLLE